MRTFTIAGLGSMVLASSLVLVSGQASADRRGHRGGDHDHGHHHHGKSHSVTVRPGPHQHHHPPSLRSRALLPPVVGHVPRTYVWPTYATPTISYDGGYAPTPVYAPPPEPSMSIAPQPMPSVVEYPGGRYELRGDGVWTPYRWVWVPNPPMAPPAEALPPPPAEAPPAPPAAAAPERERRPELYRWTDEKGTVHWTDRWEAVPEAYRATATKLRS